MAKLNQGVYDPSKSSADIAGRPASGFGPEEAIRTERFTEEDARVVAGLHGDFAFEINPDKSGSIILTLMQNADYNTFLDSLRASKTVFPASTKITHNITERASATQAMIGTAPRIVVSQNQSFLEWTIICGELIETRS